MTLSHIELDFPLELSPQTVNVLVVENASQMFRFCAELCAQSEGGDGRFCLFDGSKPLSFSKEAKVVSDIFHISFSDKKAQNALVSSLNALAEQKLLVEFTALREKVFSFFDSVNGESDFPIDYSVDTGVSSLLKAFSVRWKEDYDDFLSQLVSYVRFCANLLKTRFFVFFNLKSFLNTERLSAFYHEVMLDDICLLLVENTVGEKLSCEKVTVIDCDLAEFVV